MEAAPEHQPVSSALSYADLRRRVLTVAGLFGALVVIVSLVGFAGLHQNAIDAARHRAQSYSTILSAHLDRTMGAMDARLTQIAVQSDRLGGPTGSPAQWDAVLAAAKAGATTISSLSVIDADGIVRHSTLSQTINLRRPDFANFLSPNGHDAPDVVSGDPFVSPYTHEVLVPFGRRLVGHRGRVDGAVIATFTPESLRNFYGSIDAEGGVVRVLHRNGAVLLEEPQIANSYVDAHILNGEGQGILRGPIAEGGPAMITAYDASGDTDLFVAVSLSEAQALAAWRQEAIVGGLIIAGLLIALSLAVALILRQLDARAAAETTLLEQQHRFAEAQRLESLGQLTGGVAHDFNNLLTVIISAADSLLMRVSDDVRPRVDAILYAADNATNLIKQLLAFSRRQALQLSPVDVNSTVTAMEDMLRRSLGARVETEFVLAPNLWAAHADRAQVESALLNLAINARDAMPEGGKLTVETHNAHLDAHYASQNSDVAPGDYIALAVTDTGVGMASDVRERALEPFFTTKEVGKGSGLGLSMINGFARQSKGHVKIYSEVGHGTTVRLYLPRDTSSGAVAPIAEAGSSDEGTESILVVEDDAQVRLLAAASLKERGYAVTEATNGAEAITQLDTDLHFDLVLTDMVMPGSLTGRDVAEHALKARPGVKVLFTSGYSDASVMRTGLVQAGARFLAKPYRGGQLAATVRALLDA